MYEIWRALTSADGYMPHAHCYMFNKWLILINYLTDLVIGIAYLAISLTLLEMVRRIRLPFHWMFIAFGAFIAACGGTHFMEVITLYTPYYWAASIVKAVTAAASVATAVSLPFLIPHVQKLFDDAKRSDDRQKRLEVAHAELEDMYRRMREVDELKTRFFENISHELRTPLALVIAPLHKLAKSANLTDEQRADAQIAERNARTMVKHVNDILDLSKVDAKSLQACTEPVDVAALARGVCDLFRSNARSRGIMLQAEMPQRLVMLGDADKLEHVLVNLLSNALKFVQTNGRVACRVREDGTDVVLEVEDDGPGVPDDMRELIFERFRQADERRARHTGGTGLGLAIVREFVQLHGGSVELDRAPGSGALFRVRLPRGSVPAEAAEPLPATDATYAQQAMAELETVTQVLSPDDPKSDLPLVLIVEDNPDLVRVMRGALDGEFRVAVAGDGRQAWEKVLSLAPDAVVTDIMMPDVSGDELLERLKSHADIRAIPVLVCTALADQEMRVSLLDKGAHDYLVKPFMAAELLARVRNMVAGRLTLQRLQRSLRDLSRAQEHRNRFTATMSHELRTPLNSIIGFSEVLLASDAQQPLEKHLTSITFIHEAGTDLLRHIDDLLDLSKLDAGHLELQMESVDLLAEARAASEALRPIADRAAVSLAVAAGAPVDYSVTADSKRVRQIFYNLLSNAIKFTRAGGRVEVRLQRRGHWTCLEVVDNGIGIAPEDQARIFEPYEQVESAGRQTQGTGLGLSITRQLVRAHGWEIRLESALSEGSRFVIDIP